MRPGNKKINIAVSSCLLGKPVRYDGQHKRHALITSLFCSDSDNFECEDFESIAICPEMLAGLGTPRPAVQLVQVGDNIHALGVEDRNLDVTQLLDNVAKAFIVQHKNLGGMILQSRSPSCGLGSTNLFNHHDELLGLADGIFAHRLAEAFPGLPIREDTWFTDRQAVDDFVVQVKNYVA